MLQKHVAENKMPVYFLNKMEKGHCGFVKGRTFPCTKWLKTLQATSSSRIRSNGFCIRSNQVSSTVDPYSGPSTPTCNTHLNFIYCALLIGLTSFIPEECNIVKKPLES
ncbi:hypothetical protein E2320_016537, partial [Naja naja]